MSSRPMRSFITVLMNILIVLAVLLTIRVVIVFFGALASQSWAYAIVTLTDYITIPFGIEQFKTPYGGVFDADAAITIGVFLLAEWVLSTLRHRA